MVMFFVSDLCGILVMFIYYFIIQCYVYICLVMDVSVSRVGIKVEFLVVKDYCRFIIILIQILYMYIQMKKILNIYLCMQEYELFYMYKW